MDRRSVCSNVKNVGMCKNRRKHLDNVTLIIIQQIVTMPIYGKEALNICHPT